MDDDSVVVVPQLDCQGPSEFTLCSVLRHLVNTWPAETRSVAESERIEMLYDVLLCVVQG